MTTAVRCAVRAPRDGIPEPPVGVTTGPPHQNTAHPTNETRDTDVAQDVLTDLKKVRNIGIMAHIDAGKTTMTERILFYTGVNHKIGETHDGASTTDWMEQEKERGITITSAAVTSFWEDTPGQHHRHPRSRRLHGRGRALAARPRRRRRRLRRQGGRRAPVRDRVAPGRQVRRARASASSTRWTSSARTSTSPSTPSRTASAPSRSCIQLPIGAENDFIGVIDLIHMRALVWPGDAKGDVTMGAKYEIQEIPADLAEKAEEYRHHLVERVAEADDALMEKYLDGEELTADELKAGIRKLTDQLRALPGALRLRVQEPRRAADARRGHRLPALAARRPGHGRPRAVGNEDEKVLARAQHRPSRSPRSRSRSPRTRSSAP